MKAKTLIATMLILTSLSKAQITLETSYPANATYFNVYVVNLSNSGFKYYTYNAQTVTPAIKLYNLNHSVWKIINLPTQSGYNTSVYNISETLFNNDGDIELACVLQKITSTPPPATFNYIGKVVKEDGTQLITIPDCASMQIQNLGANGFKLFATIDSTGKSSAKQVNIYSLTGSMPTALKENSHIEPSTLSAPFPNPSQNKTSIAYQLPEGVNTAEVIIFDINGKELKRFTVDNTFNSLELDNSDLASGTYLYQLTTTSGNSSAKKMIIVK